MPPTTSGAPLSPTRWALFGVVMAGSLVFTYVYHECGWDPYAIRLRVKPYEGWDQHWA